MMITLFLVPVIANVFAKNRLGSWITFIITLLILGVLVYTEREIIQEIKDIPTLNCLSPRE